MNRASAYHAQRKPFNVRLLPKERTVIEEAAERDGMPTSTWVRRLALRAARRRRSSKRAA